MTSLSKNKQSGFTILELMIATTIFSVVLLLIMNGIINISRTYFKGITQIRTQNVTRDAMATISQAIQYGNDDPINLGGGPNGNVIVGEGNSETDGQICLGSSRIEFHKYQTLGPSNASSALLLYKGCSPNDQPPKELLAKSMQLSNFSIKKEGGNNYEIYLKITYGNRASNADDKLYKIDQSSPDYGSCLGGETNKFCASSELRTTVHKKLK